MLGRRKLIFTGLVELAGLGWGFEKQVFKVTVLLDYFDLARLIISAPLGPLARWDSGQTA